MFKKNIGKEIIVIIFFLILTICYYYYCLNLKSIHINTQILKFNKRVFYVMERSYTFIQSDYYKNYYIHYIDEQCSKFINNADQVVHIINGEIINHEEYMRCVRLFNKYYSDISYIKNDDDKFLYIQEKIKEEIKNTELLKKYQIAGIILGTTFFLYKLYKNIFK